MKEEILSIETIKKLARMNKAINNLKNSIASIDKKIAEQDFGDHYLDVYRKTRLKAIRTKCKEILEILEGEEK